MEIEILFMLFQLEQKYSLLYLSDMNGPVHIKVKSVIPIEVTNFVCQGFAQEKSQGEVRR